MFLRHGFTAVHRFFFSKTRTEHHIATSRQVRGREVPSFAKQWFVVRDRCGAGQRCVFSYPTRVLSTVISGPHTSLAACESRFVTRRARSQPGRAELQTDLQWSREHRHICRCAVSRHSSVRLAGFSTTFIASHTSFRCQFAAGTHAI